MSAQHTPLPAPRLQLRWEKRVEPGRETFGCAEWLCHYELVLPLQAFDIRREIYDDDGMLTGERDELVLAIKGPTLRTCSDLVIPCVDRFTGKHYVDTPYRDGAHAELDAKILGNLPIFVIAPDGTAIAKATSQEGGAA